MNPLKALLLDDEQDNNEALRIKLEMVCPEVQVVGMLQDAITSIPRIQEEKEIDILFLDVEMPGLNGFQILDLLPSRSFEVILVTAYADYAIQAFKAEALDYLLKPVGYDELRKAVNKVHARKAILEKLHWHSPAAGHTNQRLLLHSANEAHYISPAEILCIKGENNYSEFHLADKRKLLISKTLKEYEEQLATQGFFRIHKSSLVNLQHVRRLLKGDSLCVELSNGTRLDVSMRRKNALLQILDEGWVS